MCVGGGGGGGGGSSILPAGATAKAYTKFPSLSPCSLAKAALIRRQ